MLRYSFFRLSLISPMVIGLLVIASFPSFSQTRGGRSLGLSVAVSDDALILHGSSEREPSMTGVPPSLAFITGARFSAGSAGRPGCSA